MVGSTFQPLVVMMMLSFFAQWRFLGCYTLANTEVLVLNGTAVAAYILFLWYTIWGVIQKTPFMGVCIHKITLIKKIKILFSTVEVIENTANK